MTNRPEKKILKQQWDKAVQAIEGYHLHIYHGANDRAAADRVAQSVETLFADDLIRSSHAIGAVGPHTAPNVAVYIRSEGFGRIVQWLQMNSEGLSILIHPETGDDLKDHLDGSMWLGKQMDYNQRFFDMLRSKTNMQP